MIGKRKKICNHNDLVWVDYDDYDKEIVEIIYYPGDGWPHGPDPPDHEVVSYAGEIAPSVGMYLRLKSDYGEQVWICRRCGK